MKPVPVLARHSDFDSSRGKAPTRVIAERDRQEKTTGSSARSRQGEKQKKQKQKQKQAREPRITRHNEERIYIPLSQTCFATKKQLTSRTVRASLSLSLS